MSEAKEWIIPKNRFFETETGRNLRNFYYELILQRDCDREGKDREPCIREWMDTFDYVEVRVFPEEERIGYIFLTAYGRRVDEHYEDVLPEVLEEIEAELREVSKA